MVEFPLYIEENKIINTAIVRQKFDGLRDGRYNVKIALANKRSLPQNAYYHSVCLPMLKDGLREIGYDEVKTCDDAHEMMKKMFLHKKYINSKNGDEVVVTGSTTELSTIDFNIYLEEVWKFAAEFLSITIPSPNEQISIFKN